MPHISSYKMLEKSTNLARGTSIHEDRTSWSGDFQPTVGREISFENRGRLSVSNNINRTAGCQVKNESDSIQPLFQPLQQVNDEDSIPDELEAYVWGCGEGGALGLGDTSDRLEPVLLNGKDGVDWCLISCGGAHTLALSADSSGSQFFTWGLGEHGQLGHDENVDRNTPERVQNVDLGLIKVSAGLRHTMMFDGEFLYACGEGLFGQLGNGDIKDVTFPVVVFGKQGRRVSQVACGDMHTVVLSTEGSIFTFGNNSKGQTGHGTTDGFQKTPKMLEELSSKKVMFVAAGKEHTACIIASNRITCTWGEGQHGRLGHGDQKSRNVPKVVKSLVGVNANEVACGGYHTIVCTREGKIFSFGNGTYGQLGHGNKKSRMNPTMVESPLEGKIIIQVVCGCTHSMALASNGRLYSWGCGENGKLGHGSEVNYSIPFIIEGLMAFKVVQISSYNAHSVALVEANRSHISKRMKTMVDNKSYSDVVFVLKNDDRVYACKNMLMFQSEYFRTMFRSTIIPQSAGGNGEYEIQEPDCSKSAFLSLLHYLYSSTVDVSFEDALELYVLSIRYREMELSRRCLIVIEKGLSSSNVVGSLVKAEGLRCDALKDMCLNFMLSTPGIFSKVVRNEAVELLSHDTLVKLLKNFPS